MRTLRTLQSQIGCCSTQKLKHSFHVIALALFILFSAGNSFGQDKSNSTDGSSSKVVAPPVVKQPTGSDLAPACLPPSCLISGSLTVCPGSSTLLCAPVGMASYSWSTGSTAQCISVTTPGTYIVTISASGGCTATCHATVTSTNCSITGNGTVCPGGSTQLCAQAGATSYSWNTGATTQCITVTTSGTYTVTECINGCFVTCSKVVTVGSLNCSITGNSTICSGGSTQLCAPSGLASYSWSTGATTKCITVSSAGTYTVTISNGGCTSSCSKTVNVRAALNCNISGNTSICQGGSTQLCLPAGYQSYSWNTGATTRCITVTAAGTYYGNVNDGTCNKTCHETVTVTPVSCTITGSGHICPGGTTQLCAPAGQTSYSWSTGATSQCITVGTVGTYTVTVSNGSCTSSCSKSVSLRVIDCTIAGNTTICQGGSTQLCAPAGLTSYSWSTGATTQCILVNSQGNYSVTVNDANGCSATCNKMVTVGNSLTCNITGNTSICQGGSTQLCAPAGMASYAWSTGATTQCILVNSSGTYTVTISNGTCTGTCSTDVSIGNTPNCSITGNGTICPGGSTQLCAPAGLVSYSWSTGATTQCISVNTPGNYTVTVSGGAGCTSSCNKSVSLIPIDDNNPCTIDACNSITGGVTHTPVNTDDGNPCTIDNCNSMTGQITHMPVNPDDGNACTIDNCNSMTGQITHTPVNTDDGNPCTIDNCNSMTGQITHMPVNPDDGNACTIDNCNSMTGQITHVPVNTDDGNACTIDNCNSITGQITHTPGNPPNCNITGSSFICSGSATQLCAPPGMASYNWSTGATAQCITVSSSATYSVIVSDGNGCSSSCAKQVLISNPPPCSITGNTTICPGGTTQLCAPAGLASYSWSTGATSQCITVNSVANYSVIVTDGNGCSSSCNQNVTITQVGSCNITGNTDICQGGSTVFTVTAGTSYLWNTGATTQSITVSNPNTYSVVVTNANGCTSTCSKDLSPQSCGITLKKTPNICEVTYGMPSQVIFTYVVKNKPGSSASASGNIVDDNATPGNTADDVNIGNWGPLAPGDSAVFTHAFTISSNHVNIATAKGTSGGANVSATATAVVTAVNCNCNLSYPDNSNLPRSAVDFNESEVLRASDPDPVSCGSTGSIIKAWYGDEHALLLGVRSVSVKTAGGTTVTNYSVSPAPASPACVSNPLVGDTISSGDQAATDDADGGGRPLWPALFLTDLTVNGMNSRIGDWQQGGKGIPPTAVCGTWKSATKTIDKTHMPATVTISTDADPAKDNWNLGSGSHTPAVGFNNLKDEGYGAEVQWDINALGLIPGHTYRLVFMVHDGDQNKTGGDVGESCTTIRIPDGTCVTTPPPPPPPPPPGEKVCYKGVSHSYVRASQQWTINTTLNQATIRTTFSKNFVDNTYGANAVSWPNGHTFNQLVGSDHLQMALYDANNVKKMEFKLDYITGSNTVASGYKNLGVTGGEGSMILGNASDVISTRTSIDENLNTFGYVLTSVSPQTDANYTPNPSYPNWIYDVWYEVTVNLAPFGSAGLGRPMITGIHASPSKTGSNTELVQDTTCTQDFPRMASLINEGSSQNMVANVYPNPTYSVAHFSFLRNNSRAHTMVEVYTISGQKIATLFDGIAEADVPYNVEMNTANLPAGTYTYKIISDDEIINGRLILMK